MTEATQRPWYATHDGTTYYHIQSAAINEDNYVARVDAMDSQGDANVDLILKAVNSHDALVAALEAVIEASSTAAQNWSPYPTDSKYLPKVIQLAKEALEEVNW
jgi:hypothetical protein